jgi:cation transport ATPase
MDQTVSGRAAAARTVSRVLDVLMPIMRAALMARLIWLLADALSPTRDPFVVDLVAILVVGAVCAIPGTRRRAFHWVRTGRLTPA